VTDTPVGPTEPEIEELLGAYALDALEPDERALVEAHLATCPRCAAEVAQHHEVAGLLANDGGDAPGELWDRIAERLETPAAPSWERLAARLQVPAGAVDGVAHLPAAGDDGRAPAGIVPIARGRRPGRLATVVVSIVAAAAALAAVVLGVQVHHLNRQVSALSAPHETVTQAAQTALEDPTTQRVQLTPTATSTAPRGAVVTLVVARSGTGYVIADGLHALPPQETYQLWGSVGGQLISLGVLGSDPGVATFTFDSAAKVQAYAITAEQSGGSVQPTHQPLVEGDVTA
jgi:anti-sigma factor RsiW